MSGKLRCRITESSEVNDPLHSLAFCSAPKIPCAPQVAFGEIRSRAQAMHEVVGSGNPAQNFGERVRSEHVALDHFDPAAPCPPLQAGGVSSHASDPEPGIEQPWHQASTNISGDSGDQNKRRMRL